MRYLDLETWNRREHFEMFKGYDKPFFNLCAPVDVTAVRQLSRRPEGPSFFLATFYLSLNAAKEVESFR